MAVRAGAGWGRHGPLPTGAPVCATDAEVAAHVEHYRARGEALPPVGLVGGDLWRTLGAPRGGTGRLTGAEALRVEVDVVAVDLDGGPHWFVAHLVARRSWWRGRLVGVLSAEFMGEWDVAPRGHPGDGRVEVLDASLSFTDRVAARRRLPTGSHLPHPGIAVRSVSRWSTTLDPPLDVWLDGRRTGRVHRLALQVEPSALTVVI